MTTQLTKEELIELVTKITSGACKNERELEETIDLIEKNIPGPDILELAFHHDPELTPEEIVEKALAYKPILL